MQVILDSSFARPGSAPIWGGKKGEFRDWTSALRDIRGFMFMSVLLFNVLLVAILKSHTANDCFYFTE